MENHCGGFHISNFSAFNTAWQHFFNTQTLAAAEEADQTALGVLFNGLPPSPPSALAKTFLEQLCWALLIRPHIDMIIHPLYGYIQNSLLISKCSPTHLRQISATGYIAVVRPSAFRKHFKEKTFKSTDLHRLLRQHAIAFEIVPQALIKNKYALKFGYTPHDIFFAFKLFLNTQARARLSLQHKIWLKHLATRLISFMSRLRQRKTVSKQGPSPLAAQKSWERAFLDPRIHVRPSNTNQRIPILIATHWLELGGAEKFAVDLVRSLPKEDYAIYVTTDIQSKNTWAQSLTEHVEEILHLPEFLHPHAYFAFYHYYITTRKIRLLHIHHAPRAYEALFHIRRFHPELVVLDTLHIIELPPNSGGYPESSGRDFEPFINYHHVISKQLKTFLQNRWGVPSSKIDVIYLNVDTHYFQKDKIPMGQIRSLRKIPEGACLIGFIGRFVKQKQPLAFIDFAELLLKKNHATGQKQDLHFLMVGSGPLLSVLQKQIAQKHLTTRVHLHAEVSDPRPVYRDIDLLVMPSENEGLALVTYEAMSMETPVFFTDVGAQSEVLTSDFLFANDEHLVPSMVDKVWPYVREPDRLKEVGASSRAYILSHHQAAQTFTQMQNLYERLLRIGAQSLTIENG